MNGVLGAEELFQASAQAHWGKGEKIMQPNWKANLQCLSLEDTTHQLQDFEDSIHRFYIARVQ